MTWYAPGIDAQERINVFDAYNAPDCASYLQKNQYSLPSLEKGNENQYISILSQWIESNRAHQENILKLISNGASLDQLNSKESYGQLMCMPLLPLDIYMELFLLTEHLDSHYRFQNNKHNFLDYERITQDMILIIDVLGKSILLNTELIQETLEQIKGSEEKKKTIITFWDQIDRLASTTLERTENNKSKHAPKTADITRTMLSDLIDLLKKQKKEKTRAAKKEVPINEIFSRAAWEIKMAEGDGVVQNHFQNAQGNTQHTTLHHQAPYTIDFGQDLSALSRASFLEEIKKGTSPELKDHFIKTVSAYDVQQIVIDLLNFKVWKHKNLYDVLANFDQDYFYNEIMHYLCGESLCLGKRIINQALEVERLDLFIFKTAVIWVDHMKQSQHREQAQKTQSTHDQELKELNKDIETYEDVCSDIQMHAQDHIDKFTLELREKKEAHVQELSAQSDTHAIATDLGEDYIQSEKKKEQVRIAFDPGFWVSDMSDTIETDCQESICLSDQLSEVFDQWNIAHANITYNPIMRHLLLGDQKGLQKIGYQGYHLDLLNCIQAKNGPKANMQALVNLGQLEPLFERHQNIHQNMFIRAMLRNNYLLDESFDDQDRGLLINTYQRIKNAFLEPWIDIKERYSGYPETEHIKDEMMQDLWVSSFPSVLVYLDQNYSSEVVYMLARHQYHQGNKKIKQRLTDQGLALSGLALGLSLFSLSRNHGLIGMAAQELGQGVLAYAHKYRHAKRRNTRLVEALAKQSSLFKFDAYYQTLLLDFHNNEVQRKAAQASIAGHLLGATYFASAYGVPATYKSLNSLAMKPRTGGTGGTIDIDPKLTKTRPQTGGYAPYKIASTKQHLKIGSPNAKVLSPSWPDQATIAATESRPVVKRAPQTPPTYQRNYKVTLKKQSKRLAKNTTTKPAPYKGTSNGGVLISLEEKNESQPRLLPQEEENNDAAQNSSPNPSQDSPNLQEIQEAFHKKQQEAQTALAQKECPPDFVIQSIIRGWANNGNKKAKELINICDQKKNKGQAASSEHDTPNLPANSDYYNSKDLSQEETQANLAMILWVKQNKEKIDTPKQFYLFLKVAQKKPGYDIVKRFKEKVGLDPESPQLTFPKDPTHLKTFFSYFNHSYKNITSYRSLSLTDKMALLYATFIQVKSWSKNSMQEYSAKPDLQASQIINKMQEQFKQAKVRLKSSSIDTTIDPTLNLIISWANTGHPFAKQWIKDSQIDTIINAKDPIYGFNTYKPKDKQSDRDITFENINQLLTNKRFSKQEILFWHNFNTFQNTRNHQTQSSYLYISETGMIFRGKHIAFSNKLEELARTVHHFRLAYENIYSQVNNMDDHDIAAFLLLIQVGFDVNRIASWLQEDTNESRNKINTYLNENASTFKSITLAYSTSSPKNEESYIYSLFDHLIDWHDGEILKHFTSSGQQDIQLPASRDNLFQTFHTISYNKDDPYIKLGDQQLKELESLNPNYTRFRLESSESGVSTYDIVFDNSDGLNRFPLIDIGINFDGRLRITYTENQVQEAIDIEDLRFTLEEAEKNLPLYDTDINQSNTYWRIIETEIKRLLDHHPSNQHQYLRNEFVKTIYIASKLKDHHYVIFHSKENLLPRPKKIHPYAYIQDHLKGLAKPGAHQGHDDPDSIDRILYYLTELNIIDDPGTKVSAAIHMFQELLNPIPESPQYRLQRYEETILWEHLNALAPKTIEQLIQYLKKSFRHDIESRKQMISWLYQYLSSKEPFVYDLHFSQKHDAAPHTVYHRTEDIISQILEHANQPSFTVSQIKDQFGDIHTKDKNQNNKTYDLTPVMQAGVILNYVNLNTSLDIMKTKDDALASALIHKADTSLRLTDTFKKSGVNNEAKSLNIQNFKTTLKIAILKNVEKNSPPIKLYCVSPNFISEYESQTRIGNDGMSFWHRYSPDRTQHMYVDQQKSLTLKGYKHDSFPIFFECYSSLKHPTLNRLIDQGYIEHIMELKTQQAVLVEKGDALVGDVWVISPMVFPIRRIARGKIILQNPNLFLHKFIDHQLIIKP